MDLQDTETIYRCNRCIFAGSWQKCLDTIGLNVAQYV
jgi:hypothetical protein